MSIEKMGGGAPTEETPRLKAHEELERFKYSPEALQELTNEVESKISGLGKKQLAEMVTNFAKDTDKLEELMLMLGIERPE